MPIFEITIKATKSFYVEAEDQSAALNHELVVDAMTSCAPDVDEPYEVTEGEAVELCGYEENQALNSESLYR